MLTNYNISEKASEFLGDTFDTFSQASFVSKEISTMLPKLSQIMSFKQYIQGQKKDRDTYSVNSIKETKSLDIFKILLSLIDVDVNISQNTGKWMDVDPYYYNEYRYYQCQKL